MPFDRLLSILIAIAASVALAGAAWAVPVVVNTDSSTEGIADSSVNQNPLESGFYELGWLNDGVTRQNILDLVAAGDLAGIDAVFNTVASFAWNNTANDGSTNSFGPGLVFNSTNVVADHNNGADFNAYKTSGAPGRKMFAWIRNSQALGATTKMAFVEGTDTMIFPVANDTLGFTDFQGNFASDSSLISGPNVWVGSIAAVLQGGGVDTAGGSPADGKGLFGGMFVLETADIATKTTLSFATTSASVAEDAGKVTLTVTRTGKKDNTVSVQYSTMEVSAVAGTDFIAAINQTLNFGPNVDSLPVEITINDRPGFQQSRTFKVVLSNANPPSEAELGISEVTVTITDSDPAQVGSIQFKNAPYSVNENQATATITVSRVGGTDGMISAQLTTQDISATSAAGPNQDYAPVSVPITFANGNSTDQTFQVTIVNDGTFEGDERFRAVLGNAAGDPTIGIVPTLGAPAEVTIVDDEIAPPAGTIRFSSAAFSGSEALGSSGIPITVQRTGGAGAAAIQLSANAGTATSPADFGTPTPAALAWADGETGEKTFVVPVVDNDRDEAEKNFSVSLSITSGSAVAVDPSTATVTIDDDDVAGTFGFIATTIEVQENGGSATLTIGRSGGSDGAATVLVTTGGGSAVPGDDYIALTNQPVAFADGQLSASVNLSILDDSAFAADKMFGVTLSTSTSGAVIDPASGTATVTIRENDPPRPGSFSFSRSRYSVAEAAGTTTITVVRMNGSDLAASVEYRVRAGTASASDFTAAVGILDFAVGEKSKTFDVEITDDDLLELDETVSLRLSNPTNGATLGTIPNATLTILNDDDATTFSFSAEEYTVTEGATVNILVNRTGGLDQTQSINWVVKNGTAINGSDFNAPGGTLVFEAGETQKTIAIKARNDEFPEPEETFTVALRKVNSNDPAIVLLDPSTALVSIARSDATEQTDVIISREDENWVGDDYYTTTGDGQFSIKTVRSGRTATFLVRVQNDGNALDSFILKATTSGTAASGSVEVIRNSTGIDVTDRILGDDGIKVRDLKPRAYQEFMVKVRAIRGQQFTGFALNLTVTSEANPSAEKGDVARMGVMIR